jgi:hypothetical protein
MRINGNTGADLCIYSNAQDIYVRGVETNAGAKGLHIGQDYLLLAAQAGNAFRPY